MSLIKKVILYLMLFLIRLYQMVIAPMFPPSCRHQPTCSHYTAEALKTLGLRRGATLALKRLCQCRPGGTFGYDPVPVKKVTQER